MTAEDAPFVSIEILSSFTSAETEEHRRQELLFGPAFAKIVALMMHCASHMHLPLGDLPLLIVTPLLAGQVALVQAMREDESAPSPYGVALWAKVSADVDRRLSEDKTGSLRLAPDEWQSGDILWIIDVFGYPQIVPPFLEEFVATHFPGQHPKMRVIGKQGVARVLFVGLDDIEMEPPS
ncbi:toxin-activating lysine-acyltransferase [Bradyrhizobium sp. HKCCYLR20261]|uniref:toxin-activating lysine-acyltransferase n=1 Tax=unclassified Bradyrhizobium TaxID=2631580 RepID=UPI003EB6B8C6